MTDRIEDRLDAALNHSGAMLPAEAGSDAELRDLLQIAAALRDIHQLPLPSSAAVESGRTRLLAELAAQRRSQAKGFAGLTMLGGWLSRQLTPALFARRAAIALVALLLTFALSGVFSVSADSLPGDPLYELKLLQEQVRLSLAPSENDREAVRDELDRTRARELNEVRQEGRVVRTEISGILEAIRPASIIINGVELPIDPIQFPALQISKPGDRVVVTVQTGADGSVTVITYQLLTTLGAPARATPAPLIATMTATTQPSKTLVATTTPRQQTEDNPRPTALPGDLPPSAPTAAVTRTPDNRETNTPSHTPDGRETPRASETPRPTNTRQPSQTPDRETPRPSDTPQPTETRQLSRTPSPTQTRESSTTPAASQTPRPTETREATRTLEPSRTPEPTRTLQPTQTPEPTRTLEPTRIPDVEHAAASTPSPTATRPGDGSSH